uniref:cellulose synthase-like protein E1 isoform X2 n=1 Tax=Erigeron canadensis TaxID=72917 RepID=UPI001CB8E2FE|nr:cellulose synthase-like protein E1 isoform X2 [Erigeron canadensis]
MTSLDKINTEGRKMKYDGKDGPLFETIIRGKEKKLKRVFATTVLLSIIWIWIYRTTQVLHGSWRLRTVGMFVSEICFGVYWVLTQSVRWNPTDRRTFKQRLFQRYENKLPEVDIFVCTANPVIEPPMMVISTVLSVMAYDYPPEKLAIYLSDDGGSELTFYALNQAAVFSKYWLPYCRNYKVEPLSPTAYFNSVSQPSNTKHNQDFISIQKLFVDMKTRIENVTKIGRVPEELRLEHEGFAEWDSFTSPRDHSAIIQIMLDHDHDIEGKILPKLVYIAREKRPAHSHNFKAGAMNTLVDLHGHDGVGGPLYIGTNCFHRRDILSGKSLNDGSKINWRLENHHKEKLEYTIEKIKSLASCTFEINTEWGKEIGLKYGCPVEDVLTGLSIHYRGWKSVYYNPKREAFLGVTTTTLDQTLVQHKRWSEGDLMILLSKYSPVWYGLGKLHPSQVMGYLIYCLWSPSSLPTLYYTIVPSLCLLNGVSLFPPVSSGWFLPFAYIVIFASIFNCHEFLQSGGTIRGWWNDRRIWIYKRTSSYLFAFLDTVLGSDLSFAISSKVADDDVQDRYNKEMMEFGSSSLLSTTIVTLSMVYLLCFIRFVIKLILMDTKTWRSYYETMAFQILICVVLVVLNIPLYSGLFFRKDNGKIPSSVAAKSISLALFICMVFSFL